MERACSPRGVAAFRPLAALCESRRSWSNGESITHTQTKVKISTCPWVQGERSCTQSHHTKQRSSHDSFILLAALLYSTQPHAHTTLTTSSKNQTQATQSKRQQQACLSPWPSERLQILRRSYFQTVRPPQHRGMGCTLHCSNIDQSCC